MANPQLDDYLVQQILSRFILPFDKWPAYQMGIIDRNGKVLKKRAQLKTQAEKNAWTLLDILCCNLRKILSSYPTTMMKFAQLNTIQTANIPTTIGQPPTIPLASLASTFFLLKDHVEDPENIMELRKELNRILDELTEDAAANSSGGGAVAGIGVAAAGGSPSNFAEPSMRRKTTASRLVSRIMQNRKGGDSFWRR